MVAFRVSCKSEHDNTATKELKIYLTKQELYLLRLVNWPQYFQAQSLQE